MRYAWIGEPPAAGFRLQHRIGLPPSVDTEGLGSHERALARLIIVVRWEDGVYLMRFDATGAEVGDTHHRDEQEAMEQAVFEFGDALAGWQEATDSPASEIIGFVRSLMS